MSQTRLSSATRRTRRGTGLFALFRAVPVLSWTGGSLALAFSTVVAATGWRSSYVADFLLMAAGAALFQGLVTHGVNDLEDWRSGTDQRSPGLLSGGSRVIPRGLLTEKDVGRTAAAAFLTALCVTGLLVARHGPIVLVVTAVGVWSALAYTLPPLRLSYRPLAGELLAGWPAVFAMVAGPFAILAGPPPAPVLWAAAVQATLSIAWVMQHHLPDMAADLAADPPKVTSPAFIGSRRGPAAGRIVPATYFAAAAALSVFAGVLVHPAFLLSGVLAGLGAREALLTDVSSVPDITRRELRQILLAGMSALYLAVVFLSGRLA